MVEFFSCNGTYSPFVHRFTFCRWKSCWFIENKSLKLQHHWFLFQDFTLDFYFRQFWTDPRLAFVKKPGVETLSVGAEFIKNIWVPDTFFVNEKQSYFHSATTSNEFIRVHHSGSITRSMRSVCFATMISTVRVGIAHSDFYPSPSQRPLQPLLESDVKLCCWIKWSPYRSALIISLAKMWLCSSLTSKQKFATMGNFIENNQTCRWK